jgi:salicylate hydroxylase
MQILEKPAFLKEAGAVIHLPPNCTALLQWMGIDPTAFGRTLLNEVTLTQRELNAAY